MLFYLFGVEVASLTVDDILEFLMDGGWHDFREISLNFGLLEGRVEAVIGFLSKFGFVDSDLAGRKVRLSSSMLDFLRSMEEESRL